MIRSFRHKGLKLLYERGDTSGVLQSRVARLEEMLGLLDVARSARELNLPGYRLHPLHGERTGFWSITVSRNWRLTFRMDEEGVYDLDLLDYH